MLLRDLDDQARGILRRLRVQHLRPFGARVALEGLEPQIQALQRAIAAFDGRIARALEVGELADRGGTCGHKLF